MSKLFCYPIMGRGRNVCGTMFEMIHSTRYSIYTMKFFSSNLNHILFYPYLKIIGSVRWRVCQYQRISLTTEPKWFSFTMQLFIGPGKELFCWRVPPPSEEKYSLVKKYPKKNLGGILLLN